MAERFVSEKNLRFMLVDVFDAASLLAYPLYAEHSRETMDMILDTALKIGKDILKPCFEEMDKKPPELLDGEVRVHALLALKQHVPYAPEFRMIAVRLSGRVVRGVHRVSPYRKGGRGSL